MLGLQECHHSAGTQQRNRGQRGGQTGRHLPEPPACTVTRERDCTDMLLLLCCVIIAAVRPACGLVGFSCRGKLFPKCGLTDGSHIYNTTAAPNFSACCSRCASDRDKCAAWVFVADAPVYSDGPGICKLRHSMAECRPGHADHISGELHSPAPQPPPAPPAPPSPPVPPAAGRKPHILLLVVDGALLRSVTSCYRVCRVLVAASRLVECDGAS